MQEETTAVTELENNETGSEYTLVSDTESTGETSSLVETDSSGETSETSTEEDSSATEEDFLKEDAVTDLESKVTINTLAENQSSMIEQQENTNHLLGGLLFAVIFFVGAYLIICFGKWIYSLIRC